MFLVGTSLMLRTEDSSLQKLPPRYMAECHSVVVQQRALSRVITTDLLAISNLDWLVLRLITPFPSIKDLVGSTLMVRLASRSGCTIRQTVVGTSIPIDSVVDLSSDSPALLRPLLFLVKDLENSSLSRALPPSRQSVVKLVLVKRTSWYRVEHSMRSSSIRLIESSPSTMKRSTEEHLHTTCLLLSMLSLLIMDSSLTQSQLPKTMVM